jgi:hypothetical protein
MLDTTRISLGHEHLFLSLTHAAIPLSLALLLVGGCAGGTTSSTPAPPPVPATYTLTVNSLDPTTGVGVTASPADLNAHTAGTTGTTALTFSYTAGTTVTLYAPSTAGKEIFTAWTGCTSAAGFNCTITIASNATVTAVYRSAVTINLTPGPTTTATIGNGIQFFTNVTGATDTSVVYTLTAPGSTLSPGTIATSGLYQTPYPAPASVTITATSNADPVATASTTISLAPPAATAGPMLTVDTPTVVRPISPLIYGMNNYQFSPNIQGLFTLPVERWGGDLTSNYNYLLDVTNNAADYYFETFPNTNTAYPDVSDFNAQVNRDRQYHTTTLATVPMVGYVARRKSACGFSVAKYGAQKATDPYNPDCGNGVLPNGNNLTGNDPTDTSTAVDQTFTGGWVAYLVKKYGAASAGGVAIYALDNEPEYWSGTHRDVHPAASTYDEITNKGLAYARAIKTADASALVTGPVISGWNNYFYSWADLISGWSTGPNYVYNGNPADRKAHNNTPFLAYYLQQFAAAQAAGGTRLLDYLDLHGYYAAANATFNPAGDTALQAARLNSTRVLWDPTYTVPAYTDPNSAIRNPAAYPVQLIPFMHQLVNANYPGTKLALTEYNWGAQESVNGALAQAEVLALFGREGLDLATIWGPPDPVKQLPGLLAFQLFQNYDSAGSPFGDGSLSATSADQSKLAIYAAQRSKDNVLTVLILNKTFGDLTSTVALTTSATAAHVYQYSNANTSAITHLADLPVTTTAGKSTVTTTFPAQSFTLLVMNK